MGKELLSGTRLARRIYELARPYRMHIAGVMALSVLSVPLSLLTPVPLKIVVDHVLGSQPLPRWLSWGLPVDATRGTILVTAVGLVIATALLAELLALTAWVLQTYTTEQLLLRFRTRLFAHVQRLSMAYHDTRGTTDSIYRIQYDTQSVQNLAINGVVPFLTAALTLMAMSAVLASLDRAMAVVALVIVPIVFGITRTSTAYLRNQWAAIKKSDSSSMAVVHEVLGALRVVRAFGQESREEERYREHSSRTVAGQVRLARAQGAFDLSIGVTMATGMAITLYLGASRVESGAMTIGELVLVMTYMTQLLSPIQTIAKRLGQLQGAVAGAERAFALLDEETEVSERAGARTVGRSTGTIRFQDVSFGYSKDVTVLHHASFDVPAGARVGIVGPTGAGKTTLINLLARLYDPTHGAILLDGVDLRDYKVEDLRRQFAIVLQEPVLFSTTIAENISYAKPGATDEEIRTAARLANADDFIMGLPEGYETTVGERGLRLSGGERQRISLARAFLKDAPILVLDEPTSSVDVGTESVIIDAVHRLMEGRTTFMIAHRLGTLERCDLFLMLEQGTVRVSAARAFANRRQGAATHATTVDLRG